MTTATPSIATRNVKKARTGIRGFDEICGGGLPEGRVTVLCGGAGSGKTLFGVEFLVRGARDYAEPGVLVSFDESARELAEDIAPFGLDHEALLARRLLAIEVVRIGNADVSGTAGYDLDGLLLRIERSVAAIGAKRIVLDAVDGLFDSLPSPRAVRMEFSRMLRALKGLGAAIVITCERGTGSLSRHGLEEYLADCVIVLDHRVQEQITTRRLRIVKCRGSTHAKDEVPFTIDDRGFNLAPVSMIGLDHPASAERVSTGIPRLDTMLDGKGLFRGSTVLVSGVSGTGKTSLAAHALAAACARGERCLYFAFEESSHQIIRNLRSIGLDLAPWIEQDLLRFCVTRPTAHGLERHLATMEREVGAMKPSFVVVDPISGFGAVGTPREVSAMLMRLVDYFKRNAVTAILTNLAHPSRGGADTTSIGLSSVVDTWFLVQFVEGSGERNRALFVLKSRGMAHSNQVREFVMTSKGIDLVDVYVGPSGVLTGAARHAQTARERAEAVKTRHEAQRRDRELASKQRVLEARIAALHAELEAASAEAAEATRHDQEREAEAARELRAIALLRQADEDVPGTKDGT